MAALCLTVTRGQMSLEATGPKELSYMKAAGACRDLVGLAGDEFVSAYTAELLPEMGIQVEPSRVLDVGHKLGDPLDRVLLDAEDLGLRVHRAGEVFHIVEESRPLDAALKVVARGQRLARIGVSHQGEDERTIVAWSKPVLAIEKRAEGTVQGEMMVLRHLEPSDMRRLDPPTVRSFRTAVWAGHGTRPDQVVELLSALHI